MKVDVGPLDKTLRIVVGIALLAVVFLIEGPMRWWGLIGFIPLLTGLFGYCPLYAVFGFDTCPLTKKPS